MTNNIGVVISRYNEDVNWSDRIQTKYIYNKGNPCNKGEIFLPNIGREAHTYLHHIVTRYDILENITVFLQGNPFDHGFRDVEQINQICIDSSGFYSISRCGNCPRNEFDVDIFGKEYNIMIPMKDILEFPVGAQFAVMKDSILKNSVDFYYKLYYLLSTKGVASREGHTMERSWKYIFTK